MLETQISEILMKSRPFRYLTKTQMNFVQSFGQMVNYTNKDVILSQGKVGNGLYVVISGKAEVEIRILGKESHTLAELKEGEFFGEANLLNATQSTATVRSTHKTLCFFLSRVCFDAFSFGKPDIRYEISRALLEDVIQRYRSLNANLVQLLIKQPTAKKTLLSNTHQTSPITKDILSHTPVFHKFTDLEKEDLITNTRLLSVKGPTSLIEQKQKDNSCYLILEGAILTNIVCKDKISHFVVHPPHTLICPPSFIDKKDEIFSYHTSGFGLLLEITQDYLNAVAKKNPTLWYKFYDLFCDYIFSLQKNLNTEVARLTNEQFLGQDHFLS